MSKTVTQLVTDYILDEIKKGNYTVGDKLPSEREIMETLSVGRSSVREAMRSLSDMNVLEKRMGIGVFVKQTEVNHLVDSYVVSALLDSKVSKELLEFRLMLEVEVCGKAAEVATEEDLHRMELGLQMHREAIRFNRPTLEADLTFHGAIVAAAKNYVLSKVYESIADLLKTIREELLSKEDKYKSYSYHEKIFEAIRTRDVEAARATMRAHLLDVAEDYGKMRKEES
ncbi:FadR/GntR family transcriptional regulator [Ammoniphilus sp. CFH 90114]|uniref:FadR/GntR family transcriptional regulator n=1 Tax=Ammoniphilus sp. CFH 90114 TaxID=2493665 RepID=UPI00100DDADF|nr:FadR/GntR family transcriptional regulator [Ammoniphilus sp. CFH 90114]RXT07097.1 FadR family transcriptional regulator [Ammoniphilus sp. CFH 90114]